MSGELSPSHFQRRMFNPNLKVDCSTEETSA
jgi:hypothetical protein